MYLYFADSVTFKDVPPFIAVSGKDWATSNLNDNLHVHVLYFLTYWPLFVIFWQLVVNSLMNTFLFLLNIFIFLMIVRIVGWNVTLQWIIVSWRHWLCLSMLIVLLNVSFSLMIVRWCYWFSFGVIDCQLRTFKCPLGVLDCRKMLLFVRWHYWTFINMQIALLNVPWCWWSASWCYRMYICLIDSTLRKDEYLFCLNDQQKV